MQKQVEIPDFELKGLWYNSRLEVYLRDNEIIMDFFTDGTGDRFVFKKKRMKQSFIRFFK